eukprot:4273016-Prymnesium_polylepis.1
MAYMRRVAVAGATRALRCRGYLTYRHPGGLWPMMRRVVVEGATRALRCRDWHEVRVDERTGTNLGLWPMVRREAVSGATRAL